MDDSTRISLNKIEEQEVNNKKQSEALWGKDRNGFCDYTINGIELMLQGMKSVVDLEILNGRGEHADFNRVFRLYSYCNFIRVSYTFKALYNLFLQGYYNESAILLRNILESFVQLLYISKSQKSEYIRQVWSGHYGYNGNQFKVTRLTQFDSIAPGLYKYYRILCDFAHGSIIQLKYISTVSSEKNSVINFNDGIILNPYESTFIINQFSVMLLAHLLFMRNVFPEILDSISNSYKNKFEATLDRLWALIVEISNAEQNREWYNAFIPLLKYQFR